MTETVTKFAPDQQDMTSLRTDTRMMTTRDAEDTSQRKSARSYGSKRSTVEDELRSLSTTPRMSHEDLGRIVSPPSPEYEAYDQALETLQQVSVGTSGSTQTLIKLELKEAKTTEKRLEQRLKDIDEERKDLNVKMAGLRVKLGVANANYNVSKTECDQLRKKFQETQIKQARFEERIEANTKELARLTDPNNPDSNVNIKKTVLNDRKEIKALKGTLEETRAERSEIQKQIEQRDARIKELNTEIKSVQEKMNSCQSDFEVVRMSAQAEREKRQEVEAIFEELLEEKEEFDKKMEQMVSQLRMANAETSEVKKQTEVLLETEQKLRDKLEKSDKQLRDTLTSMEQEKNADMPIRTASSIKYHQYRMARTGAPVTDTTPRNVAPGNSNGSVSSSGTTNKGVTSLKPASSLTSLPGSKPAVAPSRGKPASLPARK